MNDNGYSSPKVSEMKVLSTRFKSKDDRNTNKKMSKREQAKEEQERRRSELEEVEFNLTNVQCIMLIVDGGGGGW